MIGHLSRRSRNCLRLAQAGGLSALWLRGHRFLAIFCIGFALASPSKAVERISWSVEGAQPELAEALRSLSRLEAAVKERRDAPREILSAALADYSVLLDELFARGHLGAILSIRLDAREASDIPLLSVPGRFRSANVSVQPGPVFDFGKISIEPIAPAGQLPAAFEAGKPARLGVVVAALDSVVEGWRAAGHAKARIADQQVSVDHRARSLSVRARVDPGPRVRFGRLILTSQTSVRAVRIQRIAGFPAGQWFSPAALRETADRLRQSGAFASVSVTEAPEIGPNGELDILIAVTDERPRRIGFGGEISGSEGGRLTGFWLHRNAFGGAERFRVEAEVSDIGTGNTNLDYALGTMLEVPAAIRADTHAFFGARAEHDYEPEFRSFTYSLSAGLRRQFSQALEASASVVLEHEETDDAFGRRSFSTVSLPVELTLDRRDRPLDATSGFFLNGEIAPFTSLEGDVNGARTMLDARGYYSLGTSRPVVLAGRVRLGSLLGAAASEVGPDRLFFSGGGNSVRGRAFQSLGVPVDETTSVGGRSLVEFSGEVRLPLTETLGMAGFVDTGYVGPESLYDGSGSWHSGAGVGLRYNTPVGPIRLDVAAPLGEAPSGGIFVYIGIGQAF